MRYKRAVEKLKILAEACDRMKLFWVDSEPFLKAVYAFGEVADGADPLEIVQVAVAINLPPEEVPWECSPMGADWLADELRLSKGGFLYFWRSYLDPVWNHHIRGPVRIWSVDGGPDEQALAALEARDFGSLNRLVPEPADERLQLREDLEAALAHLREVRDKYWDQDWRREHRGYGRYPENELWEAVEGFLDLVDASRSSNRILEVPYAPAREPRLHHAGCSPGFASMGGWLWLRTQQTPYAGLQCRAGAARNRILGYDVTIIGGSAMEMRAFESVDQAAASAIAMLQDGERLSRLWRYVFVQMLDDYTSVLHHAGVSAAAEMWSSAPRSTGDVRVDAAFAAMAEYLARRDGWTVPSWARLPGREAWPWWFVTDLRGLHPRSLVESPSSFRRRGVFITSGALDRT